MKENFADANVELAKLIGQVLGKIKEGDVEFSDTNFNDLFQVNKYHLFRENYRELLVKIVFLSDDNPIKKEAYAFIGKIIEATGEFDVPVILAMTYHKMTSLTADLLCKYANEIGSEGVVGYIIYNALNDRLNDGFHHDVLRNTRCVLSRDEDKMIRKIVAKFRQFAK